MHQVTPRRVYPPISLGQIQIKAETIRDLRVSPSRLLVSPIFTDDKSSKSSKRSLYIPPKFYPNGSKVSNSLLAS